MLELLNQRLGRLHRALAGLATDDLSSIRADIMSGNGVRYAHVDFSLNSDPNELANKAYLLIANIASLKDHLKLWCNQRNLQFEGDKLIDSNISVALIHDLWNLDKHAALDKKPRSGRVPKLTGLRTSLVTSAGTEPGGAAFFTMDPFTGKMTSGSSGGGSVRLALEAQIVDEAGTTIADFTETCQKAVEEWSKVLKAAGVSIA